MMMKAPFPKRALGGLTGLMMAGLVAALPAEDADNLIPNDPEFYQQWGHEQISGIDTDIITAWAMLKPLADTLVPVTVAVFDADIGLNSGREFDYSTVPGCDIGKLLKQNIFDIGKIVNQNKEITEENCLQNLPADQFPFHGLAVSGVIAASSNNHRKISGVVGPYDIKIMPLKGPGSKAIAAAIRYAADQGIRIFSISYGALRHYYDVPQDAPVTDLDLVQDALDHAYTKGMLVVASLGNNEKFNEDHYPASSTKPNVLGVASINHRGHLAVDWNGNGAEFQDHTNYGRHAAVAAPGTLIQSVWFDNGLFAYDGPHLDLLRDLGLTVGDLGTSFAAPYVAGIAALAVAAYPDISVDALRDALINGVTATEELGQTLCYCNVKPTISLPCSSSTKCTDGAELQETKLVQAGGYIHAPSVLELAAQAEGETIDLNGFPVSSYPKAAFSVYFDNGLEVHTETRIENGLEVELGKSVTFVAETQPSYSYQWSFGDGTFATEGTEDYTYPEAGEYWAQLVVTDDSTGLKDASPPLKVTVYNKRPDYISIVDKTGRGLYNVEGYLRSGGFRILKDWWGRHRVKGGGIVRTLDGKRINVSLKTSYPHIFGAITKVYALDSRVLPPKAGIIPFSAGVQFNESTNTITVNVPDFTFTIVNG